MTLLMAFVFKCGTLANSPKRLMSSDSWHRLSSSGVDLTGRRDRWSFSTVRDSIMVSSLTDHEERTAVAMLRQSVLSFRFSSENKGVVAKILLSISDQIPPGGRCPEWCLYGYVTTLFVIDQLRKFAGQAEKPTAKRDSKKYGGVFFRSC